MFSIARISTVALIALLPACASARSSSAPVAATVKPPCVTCVTLTAEQLNVIAPAIIASQQQADQAEQQAHQINTGLKQVILDLQGQIKAQTPPAPTAAK